jgi:transcriptional regulator with XRE-family HTH domain
MRFRKIPETAQRNISGLRLREARLSQQPPLTQEQLSLLLAAAGLVLERVAIAKIENGQRCVFDHELKHFAIVLDRPADWFLGLDLVAKAKAGKKNVSNPPKGR